MRARVLGSAAGGGLPQWNCACDNCRAVRAGAPGLTPRTQDSLAVSADGDAWVLLNASPDIHAQIRAFPALHPRAARHTPIAAIVLTNGDIDHILGLFSLREAQPLHVLSTAAVRAGVLEQNVIARTLQRFDGHLTWTAAPLDRPTDVAGLSIELFAVPGKRPVHLEHAGAPSPEDNVGVLVTHPSGGSLAYMSSAASLDDATAKRLSAVDAVLFDGTFWTSDELSRPRLMNKRAEEMSHWPVGGDGGSLSSVAALRAPRKIYTHVNNTNPMLREGSPERRAVEAAGVEVAFDGLEIAFPS